MSRKPDTINYKEFNKLTDHNDKSYDPLPAEVLFDDENINQLEATLMGMEYDNEDFEELQDWSDLEEKEEETEVARLLAGEQDNPKDLDADKNDEIDESSTYI